MNRLSKTILYLIIILQTNFFLLQDKLHIPFDSYTSKYLSFFLILALIFLNWSKVLKQFHLKRTTYKVPILFFVITIFIVSMWTIQKYNQSFFSTFTASYYYYTVILYFFLVSLMDNKRDVANLFRFCSKLGFFYSLFIIIQDILFRFAIYIISIDSSVNRVQFGSVFAGFYRIPQPADFVSFSILCLLILMIMDNKINFFQIIFLIVDMFYIVFVSQTRAYIVLDFLLIIMFILFKLKKVNVVISIMFMCLLVIFASIYTTKIVSIFTSGSRQLSFSVRLEAITYYFDEMKESPLFGIGVPNTYNTLSIIHGNMLTVLGYQYYLDDVGILGFIFSFGIIGIISMLTFVDVMIKDFIRSKLKFCMLLPIIFIIVSSISTSLLNPQRIIYFPFVLFLISYFSRESMRKEEYE